MPTRVPSRSPQLSFLLPLGGEQQPPPEPQPSPPKRTKPAPLYTDAEIAALFTDWYARYPRHVARRAALAKFGVILRNREATPDELNRGAERYAEECDRRGRSEHYICHPATWLNAGRWADQPSETVDPTTDAFYRAAVAIRARSAVGD